MRAFSGIKYNDREACITSRLRKAGWQTLISRRKIKSLNLLQEIYSNNTILDRQEFRKEPTYYGHRDHMKKIKKEFCATKNRKNSFFPRTISNWNNLPKEVMNSGETKIIFKNIQMYAKMANPTCDHLSVM